MEKLQIACLAQAMRSRNRSVVVTTESAVNNKVRKRQVFVNMFISLSYNALTKDLTWEQALFAHSLLLIMCEQQSDFGDAIAPSVFTLAFHMPIPLRQHRGRHAAKFGMSARNAATAGGKRVNLNCGLVAPSEKHHAVKCFFDYWSR